MPKTFHIVKTNEKGLEKATHGTLSFPIKQYHNDFSIMDTVEWHWHPEFEAGIVRTGTLAVRIAQNEYFLDAGDGFFTNVGTPHSDFDANHSACQLDSVVFHPRLIDGGEDSVFGQNYLLPIMRNSSFKGIALYKDDPNDAKLLDAIRSAIALCDRPEVGYEFEVRNTLSELIVEIFKRHGKVSTGLSKTAVKNEERIKVMLSFIEEHYEDNITLESIAASAAVSKPECVRCFNNNLGRSPIQFLKEYRLQKAAYYIRTTDRNINDIASSCGFYEMSYFARSFKSQYSSSPTEYRRVMQRGRKDSVSE